MAQANDVICNRDLFLHIQKFANGYEGLVLVFRQSYGQRMPISTLMEEALANRNWRVAKKLYENNQIQRNGYLFSRWDLNGEYPHRAYSLPSTCEWLHYNMGENFLDWKAYMTTAAGKGDLSLVMLLHNLQPNGCSAYAMDFAAEHGYFDVVKFLHENCSEGCTVYAMNMAAGNGHLQVVKYLHVNRTEGCNTLAFELAAMNGYLGVVQFLHENRSEGCITTAREKANANGHIKVVEYLDNIWSQ